MTRDGLFLAALALSLAGYASYLVGLRRHLVEPNRASWLIWAAAAAVEAATYAAVNPHALQGWVFGVSALACTVITAAMWRRSRWSAPSASEALCMGAALGALLLWIAFQEAFWAHMLVVLAVPVSFWPTWASVWEDRARERSPAWGLWTLGDLATLILATRGDIGVGEIAYVLVELGCHASVWVMVGLATINPLRSLGRRQGGLLALDALTRPANPFAVAETHLGKAVFATQGFAAGAPIVRFSGPRLAAAQVPAAQTGARDRHLQITADLFLGPSGRIDDLINHSCAPNAGLRFAGDTVLLVAIRDIAPGEEIAWDYSTTLGPASDWRMACACGSAACRGVIGAFDTLPAERQLWFLDQGLTAPYLRPAERRSEAA